MEYREIIRSAIQALKGNILRTSLTMLGIIIGITSVILIYSIGQGAVQFITDELTSFGIDYFQINPGKSQFSAFAGSQTLTYDDYEAIKDDSTISNIKAIAPLAFSSVAVTANSEEDELLVYGVTPEILDILRPDVVEGEFITEEQHTNSERVAVLGSDVVETFFGEDSSALGESVQISNRTFRTTGVVNSSSVLAGGFLNNAIFIPIDVAMTELTGDDTLQEIDISVHNPDQINQTIEDVETLLRDLHGLEEGDENNFQIQSAQDMLSTVQTITGLLTVMIVAISGISLVVGGVGVMNIMLVSVTERTKEIGLLKAIGAKEKDILTQFLIESVVMTLIGGIIGIVLGTTGAFIVSSIANIPFVFSIPAILAAVAVSTSVGIVFGLYPAKRAAQLSPIDALRYE